MSAFGRALGWDAMNHHVVYALPEMAKRAFFSLAGKDPTCSHSKNWTSPSCGREATAWYTSQDLEGWTFYICDDHVDLSKRPYNGCCHMPPDDKAAPEGIDTTRFGYHYRGSLVTWLKNRRGQAVWRTVPKTARKAHIYLYGSDVWCCEEGSLYWLGRDEGSGEDKWDYACGECVNEKTWDMVDTHASL